MSDVVDKDVLISIQYDWVSLILSGLKTVELRKRIPNLKCPIKYYIYCTKGSKETKLNKRIRGKVVGWFICECTHFIPKDFVGLPQALKGTCVNPKAALDYANGKPLYGIHVSKLCIYDTPRPLSDFGIKRAPQSWCYIEERHSK